MNPTKHDFTHYSYPHNTYARMYHIFLSISQIPWAVKSIIRDVAWSDHSIVSLLLHKGPTQSRGYYWRLNELTLCDPIRVTKLENSLKEYFTLNKVEGVSEETLWAAHKATIRGKIIQIATQIKKERQIDIERLEREFLSLKKQYKKHPSNSLLSHMDATRLALNLALTTKVEKPPLVGGEILSSKG